MGHVVLAELQQLGTGGLEAVFVDELGEQHAVELAPDFGLAPAQVVVVELLLVDDELLLEGF